jgi:hypothetical protein
MNSLSIGGSGVANPIQVIFATELIEPLDVAFAVLRYRRRNQPALPTTVVGRQQRDEGLGKEQILDTCRRLLLARLQGAASSAAMPCPPSPSRACGPDSSNRTTPFDR